MTKNELKEYFKQGKIPTENNFSELIDFITYSHKEIIITNQENWNNFINNYIINNTINSIESENNYIINGYYFIINNVSNIAFYNNKNIIFINCTFKIKCSENYNIDFNNCNLYNCNIYNEYCIIQNGNYYNSYIESYGNLIFNNIVSDSKIKLYKTNVNLKINTIQNSIIEGGTIDSSQILSSDISRAIISSSINDSYCKLKDCIINDINFSNSVKWIDLIKCTVTSDGLFRNSESISICGNIFGCNFGNAIHSNVVLNGVRSCRLKSELVNSNHFFADTFGTKNASEYGENSIIE